jgi:hypothetical protein
VQATQARVTPQVLVEALQAAARVSADAQRAVAVLAV